MDHVRGIILKRERKVHTMKVVRNPHVTFKCRGYLVRDDFAVLERKTESVGQQDDCPLGRVRGVLASILTLKGGEIGALIFGLNGSPRLSRELVALDTLGAGHGGRPR